MFVEHKEVGEEKKLDEASKLLLKAADLIEERGWCQNELLSMHGQLCINGAVQMAHNGQVGDSLSGLPLEAVQRVRANVRMAAWCWNDQSTRTKEEVVAKLRAVALGG